jgi:propanediol dehydratase small subunit
LKSLTDRPFDPAADYPVAERRPDLVRTASGRSLAELTLDAVLNGEIASEELRITAEALHRQATVASASGRPALVANFLRAAELTRVPDEKLMAVYTALRPRRSTPDELRALADELETDYRAPLIAEFIREAATAYEQRGIVPEGV